ncbi:hypothetical protein LEP1GSC186_1550 [Leptospira noguchii serovar Autumnalis str. ZUN142]|uniref:Uncharacterized protein n=1 Tax=Leptospira noguchii serovar Autumnalis str. ZUN142 TaxID=1085540 RepID=M6UE71_9LEPT|nr:hypothetical protein LEP1GSC186_1550 [Leptospira noguchii serovar Autumnalis str. ZUN142]
MNEIKLLESSQIAKCDLICGNYHKNWVLQLILKMWELLQFIKNF